MTFTLGKKLIAFALLASSSMAIQAQDVSYSYLEGGVGALDFDASGTSTEAGFFAGFSAQASEALYVMGSYEEYDLGRFELSLIKLGLGFRAAINDQSDFNLELAYDEVDARFAGSDGFRATVGLRSAISRWFQSRAYAGYTTDDDFDDGDFVLGLEGNVPFNDRLALTAQAESYEFDVNIFRAGLRFLY